MKKWWIVLFAMVISTSANSVDVAKTIDPSLQPTYKIQCDYPLTRTDGSPIALGEIAKVEFYRSTTGAPTPVLIGENTGECSFVENVSALAEDMWIYQATATDIDSRESTLSVDRLLLTVELIAAPSAPGGLR
jgi:hypothetical protein